VPAATGASERWTSARIVRGAHPSSRLLTKTYVYRDGVRVSHCCPDYEHASLTAQVLAAVDRLPPAAADLIKAHFLQEQTLSAAGARLGISKTRLSVHVARAIQLLREQLDDGFVSWPDASPRPKRHYSKEYRATLVSRALQPSANHSQLSREFDVPSSTLLTWLKPCRAGVQQGGPIRARAAA
jgi:hypothetical protein